MFVDRKVSTQFNLSAKYTYSLVLLYICIYIYIILLDHPLHYKSSCAYRYSYWSLIIFFKSMHAIWIQDLEEDKGPAMFLLFVAWSTDSWKVETNPSSLSSLCEIIMRAWARKLPNFVFLSLLASSVLIS